MCYILTECSVWLLPQVSKLDLQLKLYFYSDPYAIMMLFISGTQPPVSKLDLQFKLDFHSDPYVIMVLFISRTQLSFSSRCRITHQDQGVSARCCQKRQDGSHKMPWRSDVHLRKKKKRRNKVNPTFVAVTSTFFFNHTLDHPWTGKKILLVFNSGQCLIFTLNLKPEKS